MNKRLKSAVLTAIVSTSPMWVTAWAATVDAGTVTGQYNAVAAEAKLDSETKDIITRSDLDAKGARNLAEALAGEQDVQFTVDDMGKQTVSIRGAEPRHTLFLVDGKRLAGGLSKFNGPGDEIYRIGTDDVDHVEVVRGATAAKYGADAIGGVINVVTKIPDKAGVRSNLEWSYLENGRKSQFNHSVAVASGKVGIFKTELSWGKFKTAPFVYGDHEDSMQYYGLRYPNSVKGEIDLKEAGRIRVDYDKLKEQLEKSTELTNQYRKSGDGYTNVYANLTAQEAQRRVNRSIDWKKSFDKADLSFRHYTTELWNDTNFITVMYVRQLDRNKRYMNTSMTIPNPYFDTYHTKKTVNEATVVLTPNDKHMISLGAQSMRDFGEGTRISVPGQARHLSERTYMWPTGEPQKFERIEPGSAVPNGYSAVSTGTVPKYVNQAEITSRNYTVTDDIEVTDKLHATVAMRYDTNSKFGNKLSPKLGLTYMKSPTLRYKANVGTAFSTPGVAELYHDWEMFEPSLNENPPFKSGWYFKGNHDLKPERALNFDISVESERGKTATKLTLFRNTFRDFMQIVYDGQMASPNFRGFTHYDANVRYFDAYNNFSDNFDSWEEAKAYIESQDSVADKMDAAGDLSYVRGLLPLDDVYTYKNIAHARMQGAELAVSHEFSKKFTAKAGYTFLDARDTDTGARLEGRGRHLFNLSLQYKDEKHGFRTTFYGTYTMNYLDIRDRVATGRIIEKETGETFAAPAFTFENPDGDPVVVFQNEHDARAYAMDEDQTYTYSKEKKAREKNYGVWNLMVERDLNKYATLYAGVNNMFGASDEFLGLGGRVYKMGFRTKF